MTYSGRVDIQQVIDESPFSGFHWLLIVLGFLVLAIDGFDTAAMGYIAPTLSTEWGIHKQDLGPVLSAALLGLSLGALIAGPVSDRMGRKRVLVFSCLFFGLASLGTAWAQSLNTLTLWRFLTGLGLGAAMPNAITLISEFAPSAAAPWQLTPCTAAFRWVRRAAGRSRPGLSLTMAGEACC